MLNSRAGDQGDALSTPFPQSTLGQQLAEVAKVINVRQELGVSRQIFFCSLTGFDTHVDQLQVAHANVLRQLGQALRPFMRRRSRWASTSR